MSDPDKVMKAIVHYQQALERYTRNKNNDKMLHCLLKLFTMPVTTSHLEQTGVGRTVNSLRKLGGEVGDAAKTLVMKWKNMVSEQQETSCNELTESPTTDKKKDYEKRLERKDDSRRNSSHRDGDKNKSHVKSEKHKYEKEEPPSVKSRRNHKERRSRSKERRRSVERQSDSDRSHSRGRGDSSSDGTSDSDDDSLSTSNNTSRSVSDERASSESSDNSQSKNRKRNDDTKSKDKRSHSKSSHKRKRSRSPSKERKTSSHSKSKDRAPSQSKKRRDGSESSDSDKKRKRHRLSSDNDDSNDKHRKHREDNRKEKDRKESHRSKSETKKNTTEKSSSTKTEKKSSKSKEKKDKSVKQGIIATENGICSSFGASFADALGMLEPTSSRSKSSTKTASKSSSTKINSSSPEKTQQDRKSSSSSSSKQEVALQLPPAPPLKLEPIDLNISSLLPVITPNYRPLNTHIETIQNSRGKVLNEDEALCMVMSSKNQRTKVYSGNKCMWNTVPTLFELCTRILQDNIDALEYTGGVPYCILKPVLDRATPDQLFVMEHHNPYLIEDTDNLWHLHCQKEFRNKRREELESWREMYMRCLDEREAKLKTLKANIKQSQEMSTPVRKTQLAYVDSVVKPPRNVLKKQMKNGIEKRPLVTPSSRLTALVASGAAGQQVVPNPGSRASSSGGGGSSSSAAHMKPKKAPLMQKTLQLLKGGRFRR